jgi:aspartyl-tRNA(Asn)/glutamyl-tRNA(Gln) amidotransferase subunit C
MSLAKTQLEEIAHLARLSFDEAGITASTQSLSSILDYIAQLNSVDTSNVQPMAHPLDATQRLRDDQVTENNQRVDFQSIAPQVEAGFYLVSKVIE